MNKPSKQKTTNLSQAPVPPSALPSANCHTSTPSESQMLAEFADNVVPLEVAMQKFGLKRTTFWRFRTRHQIETTTGNKVYIADIIAGFEAERRGQRRSA